MITVDELAQEIRRVDGNHDKGAAALAEALMPFLQRSASPAGVRVKALEWELTEVGWMAKTPFGAYFVSQWKRSPFRWAFSNDVSGVDKYEYPHGDADTLEAAQTAAQADYDARIMAALEGVETPAPETHVAGTLRVLQDGIKEAEADIAFDVDAGNQPDVSEYGVSLPYETARDIASVLLTHETRDHKHGIYIASKTKHAARWRYLRDKVGEPIISTWIDEADVGEINDLADLWRRCILEASTAEVLILYREPDDVLKGGWVELGAALASGVTVFAVGIEEFTIAHDKRIRHFPDMKASIAAARELHAKQAPQPLAALATEGK